MKGRDLSIPCNGFSMNQTRGRRYRIISTQRDAILSASSRFLG